MFVPHVTQESHVEGRLMFDDDDIAALWMKCDYAHRSLSVYSVSHVNDTE